MELFNRKRPPALDVVGRTGSRAPWWAEGSMLGPHPFDDVVIDAELLEPEGVPTSDGPAAITAAAPTAAGFPVRNEELH